MKSSKLFSFLVFVFIISATILCFINKAEAQTLQVVAQLNLDDRSTHWVSTSFYGNVYSFLSSNTLWWGPISNNQIDFGGVRIPPDLGLQLATIIGFGFDPQTNHDVVQFVLYSNAPAVNNLAFVVLDLVTKQWKAYAPLVPPAPSNIDWQLLTSNSVFLEARLLYFLISIDYVLSAKVILGSFNQSDLLDLRQAFTSDYPVYNTTGAIFYKDRLFIARTGSLDDNNNLRAQIIQINVDMDTFSPTFGNLYFDHVTYLNSNCYNMFGWGNYLVWQQLDGGIGKLYAWDFVNRVLIRDSVNIPNGQVWGAASGANNTVGESLVVAGDPTGRKGYTAYAFGLTSNSLTQLSQLQITNGDTLPQLGMSAPDQPGLSVLLAGYNATGFGKITLMRYM